MGRNSFTFAAVLFSGFAGAAREGIVVLAFTALGAGTSLYAFAADTTGL